VNPPADARREEQLTEADIVTYLAHSRVTEQRASEQMRALRTYAGDRPDIARAVRVISHDEDNHLAYCHEELLRLSRGRARGGDPGHAARGRAGRDRHIPRREPGRDGAPGPAGTREGEDRGIASARWLCCT